MPGYLTVAGIAALVTFVLTFVMRWVAPRIGAVAMPGPRSVHTKPTPSLGGAAMFAGFLVAMAVASQLGQFHEVFADDTEPPANFPMPHSSQPHRDERESDHAQPLPALRGNAILTLGLHVTPVAQPRVSGSMRRWRNWQTH